MARLSCRATWCKICRACPQALTCRYLVRVTVTMWQVCFHDLKIGQLPDGASPPQVGVGLQQSDKDIIAVKAGVLRSMSQPGGGGIRLAIVAREFLAPLQKRTRACALTRLPAPQDLGRRQFEKVQMSLCSSCCHGVRLSLIERERERETGRGRLR